ncbi:MAG: capsular polysaccharide biosynthesis protein [Verrucomicrobiota bacterium]
MARWISQNRSIAGHPLLAETARLAGAEVLSGLAKGELNQSDVFIGWGYKSSGIWAKKQAQDHSASFRLFEDGFVRSLKPGYSKGALYSLVEDRGGIYYDGSGGSDLVSGLNGRGAIGSKLDEAGWKREAQADLDQYLRIGASKYNWYPDEFNRGALDQFIPTPGVLVVDQTSGDASIRYGNLKSSDFHRMLEAALEENPGKPVYVRGHPDHIYRSKRSCLRSPLLDDSRVHLLAANLAPWQVFERIERVYVGTSLFGFEALLHGLPVVTFGCSFYAGWGLSDGRNSLLPVRDRSRSVLELFHAAFRCYSRCFDPDTLEPCRLSRILDHLELQKEMFSKNAGSWVAYGMSPWKRPLMNSYLSSPAVALRHTRSRRKAERWIENDRESKLLVWGRKDAPSMSDSSVLCRVEDGFLRSEGLGAEFHSPLSLIFDRKGIYYDSTCSSDLESILLNHKFSIEELALAEKLIQIIRSNALTKYNLGKEIGGQIDWPQNSEGRRILVPGQVEGDASIHWGSPQWQSNVELLREVRRLRPDGVIAYKPHPDVIKRLRPGHAYTDEIKQLCDVMVSDLDIVPWLESCDELHTLTSLSGFEALLREKKVICYGAPFYSGWGLTEDLSPVLRRDRRLELEQLVCAALIIYPTYVNPVTGEFTTAFGAAELIVKRGAPLFARPWYLRLIASMKTLLFRR